MDEKYNLTGVSIAGGVAGLRIQYNEYSDNFSVFLIHYGKYEFNDIVLMEKIGIQIDPETIDALSVDWDPETCQWIPRQPQSTRADILLKILES